jgi:hypothetical protein
MEAALGALCSATAAHDVCRGGGAACTGHKPPIAATHLAMATIVRESDCGVGQRSRAGQCVRKRAV